MQRKSIGNKVTEILHPGALAIIEPNILLLLCFTDLFVLELFFVPPKPFIVLLWLRSLHAAEIAGKRGSLFLLFAEGLFLALPPCFNFITT